METVRSLIVLQVLSWVLAVVLLFALNRRFFRWLRQRRRDAAPFRGRVNNFERQCKRKYILFHTNSAVVIIPSAAVLAEELRRVSYRYSPFVNGEPTVYCIEARFVLVSLPASSW